MGITIEDVKRGYQYGIGIVPQPDDLPLFGWNVLRISKEKDEKKRSVVVSRSVEIANDPQIDRLEKEYFGQYDRALADIKSRYLAGQIFAVIFLIPSLFFALVYLLKGVFSEIAAFADKIDEGLRQLFTSFLGNNVSNGLVVAFGYVMMLIAVVCVIALIVNKATRNKKERDPLGYYKKNAEIMESCAQKAMVRVNYIRTKKIIMRPPAPMQANAQLPGDGTVPLGGQYLEPMKSVPVTMPTGK